MWRRVIIIGLVFGLAALLMFLKNKVFTGSQEITARVETTGPYTYAVGFRDLAGDKIDVTANERELVRDHLEAYLDENKIQRRRARLADKWAEALPDLELPERVIAGVEIGPDQERLLVEVNPPGFCVDPAPRQEDRPLPPAMLARSTTDEVVNGELSKGAYRRDNPARSFWHVNLGIDLQGGVEFICSLIDQEGGTVAADQNTVDVLRKRLDASGLTEPKVSRQANGDVEVVIPGGTQADAIRTRKVLETTGVLEFREVKEAWGFGAGSRFRRKDDPYKGQRDPKALHGKEEEPGNAIARREGGGYELVDGYLSRNDGEVLYPLRPDPEHRGDEPSVFLKLGPPILKGEDVKSAQFGHSQSGVGFEIHVDLTATGGAKNQVFTRRVQQEGPTGCIAICLDGEVASAPFIEEPSGSRFRITGSFTKGEAESLQTVFRAGSLTVKPQVNSQTVVGASLGQETIEKGWQAMVMALVLVLAIVLVYYRGLGLVAQVSLVACISLIYAVLVVFGATLTLPGIAGLVLTVGMAVDANILIFERMREEMRADVDLATCIDVGYSRAFVTILDANLTTFIAAFILYVFGSGPVKGFGLTLMIGIGTSMFAAIVLGRLLTELLYRGKESARVPGLLREAWFRLPYVRLRLPALGISLLVLVLGVGGFFGVDDYNEHFDIDFTGGHAVQVTFERPMGHEEVDEQLERAIHREGLERLRGLRKQAYLASFGAGGGESRQWVFKTIDVEGARLEDRLLKLESEKRGLLLALRRLDSGQATLEKGRRIVEGLRSCADLAARAADADALAARLDELAAQGAGLVPAELVSELRATVRDGVELLEDEHIAPLRERLQSGTEEVKEKIRQAFGGAIAAEGEEVLAAAWDGPRLTLRLETIDPPDDVQLANIQENLALRDEVAAAAVEAAPGPEGQRGIKAVITYAAAPEPATEPLVADEPVYRRLRSLLVADGAEGEAANGQAATAFAAYSQLTRLAATQGLRVAIPFPSTKHFSGTVGDQTKIDALIAMSIALVAILLYIAARFEIVFGIGSVVALLHDVVLTIGLLMVFGVPIDMNVVAALLAIIGYSLNDTIVVFDRIREVRRRYFKPLREVIDLAIAQTMGRTIMTSLTTLTVVVIIFFFGAEGLYSFSATLLIGLLLGTYSSVFVASPVVLLLERRQGAAPPDADRAGATAPGDAPSEPEGEATAPVY